MGFPIKTQLRPGCDEKDEICENVTFEHIFEGIMPLRLERRKIARLQSYRSELA